MSSATEPAVAERAGARQWLGLAVLALPTLLLSMDVTVLHFAVPKLSADLMSSNTQTLWIIDIYGFMIAGFLIIMGTLGDRLGRRKVLLFGAAGFAVTSIAAAYATSPELLIAARAAMGIAGATLMPSILALISNMFADARQRGMAIGIWATCLSVGVVLGPLLGGALLEAFWWGSVFLPAVPIMLILLIAGPVLLPEYRDTRAGSLDLISALLSLAAILPVIYGIKQFAADGLSVSAAAAVLAGLVLGVVFFRRQRTLTEPMLDLKLFANKAFVTALLVMTVSLFIVGGVYLFATFYLQLVARYSPLQASLWLLPSALAMVVTSLLAPLLVRRFSPGSVIGVSLAVGALGFLVLTQVDGPNGVLILAGGFVLIYLGSGPVMALGTDLVVGSAPPERAGSAAAMSETGMEFGLAFGVAVLGSIGSAVYGSQLDESTTASLPGEVADSARETLAGAVAVAEDLPAAVADPLLTSARAAFTDGFTVVAVVCAVLSAAMAVLTIVRLRRSAN